MRMHISPMRLSARHMGWKFLLLVMVLLVSVVAEAQAQTIYVTSQRFERGLMIYRSDNGTIYVLDNTNHATVFPVTQYHPLPDNPIFAGSPPRLRPIFGFGKVWGNNPDIRERLGWPVKQEIGYFTRYLNVNYTEHIWELDGSAIVIYPQGTWSRNPAGMPTSTPDALCPPPIFNFDTGGVCPSLPEYSQAAFQRYEHGFMIWRAARGDIWVFIDADTSARRLSSWRHVQESEYANALNRPEGEPPQGRYLPVNGFGLVWANLTAPDGRTVRDALGWATTPETAYGAAYQMHGFTGHVHQYLSLPDDVVDAYSGLTGINWSLLN